MSRPAGAPHEWFTLPDGTEVTIRPITPEDAAVEAAFVSDLSPQSRYERFQYTVAGLTEQMLERFTHPDPGRELALVAVVQDGGREKEIGVARFAREGSDAAEFAIVVADPWQGKGIGMRLLGALIDGARARGVRHLWGTVRTRNRRMLRHVASLGFRLETEHDDRTMTHVVLDL